MHHISRIVLAFLLFAGAAVQAGQVTGKITSVVVRQSDGLTYFYTDGTPTGRPACAAATTYWMIKDEDSEAGRRLYSMILTARASGAQIIVTGANTCTRWGDGEDVERISF